MYLTKVKKYSTSQRDINKLYSNNNNIFEKKAQITFFNDPSFYSSSYINFQFKMMNKKKSKVNSYKNFFFDNSASQSTEKTMNNTNNILNLSLNKIKTKIGKKSNKFALKDLSYYHSLFKKKKLNKPKQKYVNNSLNLLYSENEKIFEQKVENENLEMRKKGKPIKYSSRNKYTEILIKNIKNKLNFMNDISNFTYPKILTYKIKSFEEKIKKNKIEKKQFFSPVMERNKQFKIRNKLREKYLFNCISISKFKNISPNP